MSPPADGAAPDARPETSARPRRVALALVAVALLLAGGLYFRGRAAKQAAAGGPAGSSSAAAADRPVPVLVATVEKRDVPIYIDGLGSVTPLMTVTVKTQVDGRLERVLFKEGQFVKKGEQIAQIDARPFTIQLHTAQAAQARDRAQLANTQLNLERYTTLRGQNLVPQQQVDDQKSQVAQIDATIMGDQAAIDNARLQLDFARIVSPIDGVTGVRLVDPGNIVHAADPTGLVMITQLDPMGVLFTLPEDELPRVSKQMAEGAVSVEAWSRDGATRLGVGQVTLIDNQINQATATIKLKATFPNPSKALWPNQFVKARLLLMTRRDALVVPTTVVQRGPQGTFAYVVGPDQRAVMRPIKVELIQGEEATISSGLSAGEQVVTDGQNQLKPGSKLATKPPEKSPPRAAPEASGAPPSGAASR